MAYRNVELPWGQERTFVVPGWGERKPGNLTIDEEKDYVLFEGVVDKDRPDEKPFYFYFKGEIVSLIMVTENSDTENMVKAFGGKNTWDQKGVYVRLPSGVWTIGSTHDMPHMSGHVTDNNFNGHLCVHFLRDMSEAQRNDPDYGVQNQVTLRNAWKALTGETISY